VVPDVRSDGDEALHNPDVVRASTVPRRYREGAAQHPNLNLVSPDDDR
jgi:hypothetical protein